MNNGTKILIAISLILVLSRANASVIISDNDPIYDPPLDSDGTLSYLGVPGFPRGMTNNNPGNLKISSSNWQGKIPVNQNTDGVFEQFISYRFGIRAMTKLLINYINNFDRNTIFKIISNYAPNNENPTDNYTVFVSNRTGIGVHQVIQPDFETMRRLVIAMSFFENGRDAISDSQFAEAWNLI